MATKKILLHSNPILRQKTELVEKIDKEVLDLINDLIDTTYAENAYGVAANQIGSNKSVFVIDTAWLDGSKNPRAFINPVITGTKNPKSFEEGCLSIPGVFERNTRFNDITIKYMTIDGNIVEEEYNGIDALAIQHEVDHLNGKLFIDSMPTGKRMLILNKSKKAMRSR